MSAFLRPDRTGTQGAKEFQFDFCKEGVTKLIKRFIILTMVMALLPAGMAFKTAQAQTSRDAELAAKARAKVASIGVGQNAKVEVKLRDQSRIRGYVSEVQQDSFTVVERETGVSRSVAYADAMELKRSSGGLSTKSWAMIGAAAAGAIVTWIIVKPAICDGGAQTRGIC
jgi:hypothetical protein